MPSGGSGGGGGSGKIDYPVHMKNMHHQWLNNWSDDAASRPFTDGEFPDVATAMKNAGTAVGGNPYAAVASYDPDEDLENVGDRRNEYTTLVEDVDAIEDWPAYVTAAAESYDKDLLSQTEIDNEVAAFETKQRKEFMRNVATFNSGMLDVGAVAGTQYHVALANMEQQFADLIADFRAKLELRKRDQRTVSVLQAATSITQIQQNKIENTRVAAAFQLELSKVIIAAKSDQIVTDLSFEVAEATWDLELFSYGGNVMSAISGATLVPDPQNRNPSILGAISGGAAASLALAATGVGAPLAIGMGVVTGLGSLFG